MNLPVPLELEEIVVKMDHYFDGNDPKNGIVDSEPGTIFSPSHLKSLSLMHERSNTVTAFMSKILINHRPHSYLVKLEMSISTSNEDVPQFYNLIKASPLLELLRVVVKKRNENEEELQDELKALEIEATVCPLLCDLIAPPQLVPAIAPGRPIRRYSIYSMKHYDHIGPCIPEAHVLLALEALDANILTALNFEKTYVHDARRMLEYVKSNFPRLESLRMPINEKVESYAQQAYSDDRVVEDPEDIGRAQKQFMKCFDDEEIAPGSSLPALSGSYLVSLFFFLFSSNFSPSSSLLTPGLYRTLYLTLYLKWSTFQKA